MIFSADRRRTLCLSLLPNISSTDFVFIYLCIRSIHFRENKRFARENIVSSQVPAEDKCEASHIANYFLDQVNDRAGRSYLSINLSTVIIASAIRTSILGA